MQCKKLCLTVRLFFRKHLSMMMTLNRASHLAVQTIEKLAYNPAQDMQQIAHFAFVRCSVPVSDSIGLAISTGEPAPTQLINSADDALFERNLTQPEPCVRLYPLLYSTLFSTQLVIAWHSDATTFSAVGRCENISHLDTKFDFGWGSAMRELTALPMTLAGFKVREGKGRRGGKGGEWRGREDLFSVRPWLRQNSFCRVTTKRS